MKRLIILMLLAVSSTLIFAQTKGQSKPKKEHSTAIAIYTCPMHPEVTSSKPGKCPKCGTDLTLSKKEQMKMEVMKIYTCPMHPEVTSDKPGKCPKCGMALEEKKDKKK